MRSRGPVEVEVTRPCCDGYGEDAVGSRYLDLYNATSNFLRGCRCILFSSLHGAERKMVLPYKIATLLYCFDADDRVLLMERTRAPNQGLWSPCGGKLDTGAGESPYACACREAREEIGLELTPADLHLFGMVSEEGYLGEAHWLMFLFEVKTRLRALPPPHAEGAFAFFARGDLARLKMPSTDVEQIWPLVWKHRGGFFAAHCRTIPGGANQWLIEESVL